LISSGASQKESNTNKLKRIDKKKKKKGRGQHKLVEIKIAEWNECWKLKRMSILMEWKDAKDCVITPSDKIQGLVKFSYFVSLQTTHHCFLLF
jgi:hypothetical protein